MPSTVSNAALRTEANSLRKEVSSLDELRAGDAMVRIDAKKASEMASSGSSRAVVREAMHRSELSQKSFAIDAKQGETVISEGLGGSRNLAWSWIFSQTDSVFRKQFLTSLANAWGMNPEREREVEDEELMRMFIGLLRRSRRAVDATSGSATGLGVEVTR